MDLLQFISLLLMCTVLQLALGQAIDVDKNVGIIQGHDVEIEDAPYMAGLLARGRLVCAGSIVDERFILTTATCARQWYRRRGKRIHVGSKLTTEDGYFHKPEKKLCHERYVEHNPDNNICLLKLREPIAFNTSAVAKVGLPVENVEITNGTMVNITGWGITDITEDDDYPEFLQRATITVLQDKDCKVFAPRMTGNMLCAGFDGRSPCKGDSGGPLTQGNTLVGIASFSRGPCGQQPSIYTKVSKFVTWIQTTIQNNKNTTFY